MSKKSKIKDTAILILKGIIFKGVYHEKAAGHIVSRGRARHLVTIGDAVYDQIGQDTFDNNDDRLPGLRSFHEYDGYNR